MEEFEDIIHIRVRETSAKVIGLLSHSTCMPLMQLKQAIKDGGWIEVAELHGADHDEQESDLLALLKDLESQSVTYELMIEGVVESKEYLLNIISRWHDISEEQDMFSILEIGSPDIDTLKTAKKRMPLQIYRSTLNLVLNEWKETVESETIEWAKEELAHL